MKAIKFRGNAKFCLVFTDMAMPLDMVAYNYCRTISRANTRVGDFAPGTGTSFTSNSDQLNGTPSAISFYIRRNERFIAQNKPKTALRITNINILFDSINVLNLANSEQLYEVCKKNNYNGSYEDWFSLSGSYIRLKVPDDIPLTALDAVGRLIRHNIQITCDFINQTDETITDPELIVIYEYDGIFTKQQNYGQAQLNIVSPDDVLNSSELPQLPKDIMLMQQQYGGFSMGEIFSKVAKHLPASVKLAKKCGPDALKLVRDIVSGKGLEEGYGLTGGQIMSRGNLQSRIKDY